MESKTPLTDANEVDLNECLSVQTHQNGRRSYVEKYVPSYIARRLESALKVAEKVVRLSDELCTAVDNAAEDIGGSRRTGDILADLGPATDEALRAIEKIKGGV